MLCVSRYHITKNRYPELFEYCTLMSERSKSLRNAVLFIMRQWFTAYGKDCVQPNQQEVIDEVHLTMKLTGRKKPGKAISYYFMDKLMRCTKNPDYFNGLPSQTAQWVLKGVSFDFKGWLKALEVYYRDPTNFTGKPEMPRYCKRDLHSFTITNQECRIYSREDGSRYLHFPKTKAELDVHIPEDAVLKEVKVIPYYGDFMISVTFDNGKTVPERNAMFMAGIDLGVDNTAALVINDGNQPVLYKGGALKAMNQFYNRSRAKYIGILMKGHDPKDVSLNTKMLAGISKNRAFFMNDELHKISCHIVRECVKRNVGTIVIGKNTHWKTKASMSKKSNQEFVQIPHCTLIHMIRYKAEREGIRVIVQEESYTSKASFLDRDEIPVYDKENPAEYRFSGRRITRGLYRSENGTVISSDINGSANILRKAFPEAFEGMDVSYLQKVKTIKFFNLHTSRPKN
jgi:putative transposase